MKTNVIIKFAVVAMAALAAYAFNGNKNANELYIHQEQDCRDITVTCDFNGIYTCSVKLPDNKEFDVWTDSACKIEAKHSSPTPINMGL